MQNFSEKVVWITGASSGIGKETAIQLSKSGARLILSARREESLHHLKDSLANPDNILVLPLDLENQAGFKESVDKVFMHFGRVDMLINNAGLSQRSRILETSLEVDRKLMEVNYFGTIALTKELLPRMIQQGGGHFVVISSLTGKFGYAARAAYAASKHALHGFFESLYFEHKDQGIGVTLICPGPIQTDISKHALDSTGKPTGQMDEMQINGMPVEECVSQMLDAVKSGKREIVIGNFREKLGVKLKAWAPSIFFKMASK